MINCAVTTGKINLNSAHVQSMNTIRTTGASGGAGSDVAPILILSSGSGSIHVQSLSWMNKIKLKYGVE